MPPKIFDAANVEKVWPDEYFDDCMPSSRGFVTDYVLSTRGMGVPTIYNVWCSLFCISSAVKREAWLKWYPSRLYANLYIILVGMPGISFKSTAISFVMNILIRVHTHIKNPNLKRVKLLKFIKNKATPEAILDQMIPSKKGGEGFRFVDSEGKELTDSNGKLKDKYYNTSEITLLLSELSAMMNKSSYMETLIGNLLDLYDPQDEYEWNTIKRGKQLMRNLYTNMLGGTTESSLKSSIPKSVLGDGFLSRTIVVPCVEYKRKYAEPFPIIGGPTQEDLEKSLAWIAENTIGEYSLSKEAKEYNKNWYRSYREEIENFPTNIGLFSRKPIHVLKVAFLLSIQRYNSTSEISLQDMVDSVRIIDETLKHTPLLLKNILSGDYNKNLDHVISILKKHGNTDRRRLLQTSRLSSAQLDAILKELIKREELIITRDGIERKKPSRVGKELYRYVSEEDNN